MARNPKITLDDVPDVEGKRIANADLSALTWFRVGGVADVLFTPTSVEDLSAFLKGLDREIPVFVMGVGSNLLVRDGGIRGVVIRLAAPFNKIETDGDVLRVGAGALDAQVAKRAAAAGIAGLEFYRGIPGTIGGALRMNAGAYGRETCDVLTTASGVTRAGEVVTFSNAQMGYSYRHCGIDDDVIFTGAQFQGEKGDPVEIEARMAEIMTRREQSQPIRERTGGSTFANPELTASGGRKSWQLIESVGGRGRVIGDAQVSEQHCNFLINRGQATAADLETLGESLRTDVLQATGVDLRWEIRRVGEPA